MVTSLLPLTIAEEDLRITPGTSGMRYFNSYYLIALSTSISELGIFSFHISLLHLLFNIMEKIRTFASVTSLFACIGLVSLNDAYSTGKKTFSLKARILDNICIGDLR